MGDVFDVASALVDSLSKKAQVSAIRNLSFEVLVRSLLGDVPWICRKSLLNASCGRSYGRCRLSVVLVVVIILREGVIIVVIILIAALGVRIARRNDAIDVHGVLAFLVRIPYGDHHVLRQPRDLSPPGCPHDEA